MMSAEAREFTNALGLTVVRARDGGWPDFDGVLIVGVHAEGPRPDQALEAFDLLLTTEPDAPRPWVSIARDEIGDVLDRLRCAVKDQAVAALTAAQILRQTLDHSLDQALILESFAYSTLLASEGFRLWRERTPRRVRPGEPDERVVMAREGETLHLRLARPKARNAFDARMRDALVEALAFALEDPDEAMVLLDGEGPDFSAGGDLDVFGLAPDPGIAHLVRVQQSPARLIAALGPRLTASLHGHCIGAGIEAPAAAARVIAREGTVMRLPELGMGLIPGAGGTATIPRRIGRLRTLYMILSGAEIDALTARAWGLVDEVVRG